MVKENLRLKKVVIPVMKEQRARLEAQLKAQEETLR
jgi:hypothetical protein